MKNDLNAHVGELNYISHIKYAIVMIVNTATVYIVGPLNTFVVLH